MCLVITLKDENTADNILGISKMHQTDKLTYCCFAFLRRFVLVNYWSRHGAIYCMQCYFLMAAASCSKPGFCLCNVSAQQRRRALLPTPTLRPHIIHHYNIKLVSHLWEDMAVFCRQCQAPPSLWPGWQLLCSGSSMRLTSVSAGLTMI